MRYAALVCCLLLTMAFAVAAVFLTSWYLMPALLAGLLAGIGIWDLLQSRHSVLRNYPVAGHLRWLFEEIRPEIRQYFMESDIDGRPFDRDARALVYERSKNIHGEQPFGTELDVTRDGYEWFLHSMAPKPKVDEPFRIPIGGPDCKHPYDMALLNVSAMSFGALSSNAILALNKGAKMGSFAHDTGEGSLTPYHLQHGGDLVWEIGSGYFGCRTRDGKFDFDAFKDKASIDEVKCVSLKLSQGAKPGLGGVMPAAKVTAEIARFRGVPEGEKCVSPPYHSAFDTPRGLIEFLQMLRDGCGGKPVGFKLCVGQKPEFLGICKAMLEMEVYPDFIIVDGGEGGTGAAPLEFEDHVGTPLTEGLHFVHNALRGCGIREHIKIGCSGKVASAFDMAKRMAQGADYCNSARAMMFALGCIRAQRCHTNRCPVGVATQDPRRVRGLVVEDKAERVYHFQKNTVADFHALIAALGLDKLDQLKPDLLMKRISETEVRDYAELYPGIETGALVSGSPLAPWDHIWKQASPDTFRRVC